MVRKIGGKGKQWGIPNDGNQNAGMLEAKNVKSFCYRLSTQAWVKCFHICNHNGKR